MLRASAFQDRAGDVKGDVTHGFAGAGVDQGSSDFGPVFVAFGNS